MVCAREKGSARDMDRDRRRATNFGYARRIVGGPLVAGAHDTRRYLVEREEMLFRKRRRHAEQAVFLVHRCCGYTESLLLRLS